VLVFASPDDANRTVSGLPATFVAYRKARVSTEGGVEGYEVPGVNDPFLYELSVERNRGLGTQRFIGGSVAHVAFVVSGSGFGDGWAWSDLIPIASAQALKIGSVLEGST
jgi:hypothetical protein